MSILNRRELTIDWYQPSEQFLVKLLQAFVRVMSARQGPYPPSTFDSTLIRLPSIAPALRSVDELCTDLNSLQVAVGGSQLFELTQLNEARPFLRECPNRHPFDHLGHSSHQVHPFLNLYPTPCLSTLYELRRRLRKDHENSHFPVLRVEIIRSCELRDHSVENADYRHLHADEISVTIGRNLPDSPSILD